MTERPLKLSVRLSKLPADQIVKVRNTVMRLAGISRSAYYRFIREEQTPDYLLQILAHVLGCTMEDVKNPAYKFRDPELPETEAAQLGLSK